MFPFLLLVGVVGYFFFFVPHSTRQQNSLASSPPHRHTHLLSGDSSGNERKRRARGRQRKTNKRERSHNKRFTENTMDGALYYDPNPGELMAQQYPSLFPPQQQQQQQQQQQYQQEDEQQPAPEQESNGGSNSENDKIAGVIESVVLMAEARHESRHQGSLQERRPRNPSGAHNGNGQETIGGPLTPDEIARLSMICAGVESEQSGSSDSDCTDGSRFSSIPPQTLNPRGCAIVRDFPGLSVRRR